MVQRIAQEQNWTVGKEIGYKMRFDSAYSPETSLEFFTYGMLIREIIQDPMLNKYSVIMIDEAHERSLNCDIILMMLKKILKLRLDLKLIITSATLNYHQMQKFFQSKNSKINIGAIEVQGRLFPVEIFHTNIPVHDYVQAAFDCILKIHKKESIHNGDVLVFVPNVSDINRLCQMIEDLKNQKTLKIEVINQANKSNSINFS